MSDYCTLAELKAQLGITDSVDDTALGRAVTFASRAVEDYCGGAQFWQDTAASTRLFWPENRYCVLVDPFVDTASLVVKVDTGGGTYATTVDSTFVLPAPYTALTHGKAYTRIEVVSGALPIYSVRPPVQVTAKWGYASTPEAVKQATILKAAKLFRRKDSPDGVAGNSQFGVVRVSRFEDPDVASLLAPYCVDRNVIPGIA